VSQAFDEAISELDSLGEESYSFQLLQEDGGDEIKEAPAPKESGEGQ
jgi:14-3-3 protein epsilon